MELIRKVQNKCDTQDRASLLKTKEKPLNQISRVPLVLTYHPTNPPLIKIIRKYWRVLEGSRSSDIYAKPPVIAYRRLPNIKESLVKARVSYPPPLKATQGKTVGNLSERCTKKQCKICAIIPHTDKFKSELWDQHCNWYNIIDLISCQQCQKQDVGETKRTFNIQMKEHLADIKHARDTPVAKHFNQIDHVDAVFTSLIMEAINPDVENPTTTSLRRSQETYILDPPTSYAQAAGVK